MLGFNPYNYRRFTRDRMMKDMAALRLHTPGPEPGDDAPDFSGRTLDGDRVRLSDFAGKRNVVLTFGSATCPMTAGSVRGINSLCERYRDDAQFFFVYVREAHPGEELPAHEEMEDKIEAAELLRDEEDLEMPILVDDLKGSIHRKYGKLPNATFVIDKAGRIAFRSLWSRAAAVGAALEELLELQQERGVEHAIVNEGEDVAMPITHAMLYSHRALERGGDAAMDDFREALGATGRMALVTSRFAEPLALHPWRVLSGALLASGVIAGALYAGHKLRQRRLRPRTPYDIHEPTGRQPSPNGASDYEAVGI